MLLLKETLATTRSRRCYCCSRSYRCSEAQGNSHWTSTSHWRCWVHHNSRSEGAPGDKVVQVLNESTLTPQGAHKLLLLLTEIALTPQGAQKLLLLLKETLDTTRSRRCYGSAHQKVLREHKVTATGPPGATGGAGSTTRCYRSEGDQGAETLDTTRSRRWYCSSRRYRCSGSQDTCAQGETEKSRRWEPLDQQQQLEGIRPPVCSASS